MPNRRRKNINGTLECPCCKRWVPIKDFHKSNKRENSFYGVVTYCKNCLIEKRIKWHSNQTSHLKDLVRKAEKRGRNPFELSSDWILKQFEKQKGLCFYTSIPMTTNHGKGRLWTNVSIDRKNSEKGYTLENCVLCCTGFNLMKTNLKLQDMKIMCELFLSNCGKL